MIFEFRKWGRGSSCYSAYVATYYNPLAERFDFKSIGLVEKKGSRWFGESDLGKVEGATRKEVCEKLADLI